MRNRFPNVPCQGDELRMMEYTKPLDMKKAKMTADLGTAPSCLQLACGFPPAGTHKPVIFRTRKINIIGMKVKKIIKPSSKRAATLRPNPARAAFSRLIRAVAMADIVSGVAWLRWAAVPTEAVEAGAAYSVHTCVGVVVDGIARPAICCRLSKARRRILIQSEIPHG